MRCSKSKFGLTMVKNILHVIMIVLFVQLHIFSSSSIGVAHWFIIFLVPNAIRRWVFPFLLFLIYQFFVPTLTSQFCGYIAHPMETFPSFLHMAFNWTGFACITFIFRFARWIRTPVHECYCDNNLSAIGCFGLFLNLRYTIDVFVSR